MRTLLTINELSDNLIGILRKHILTNYINSYKIITYLKPRTNNF